MLQVRFLSDAPNIRKAMNAKEREQYVISLFRVMLNKDTVLTPGKHKGLYELSLPIPPLAVGSMLQLDHTVFDIYTEGNEEPLRLVAYEHLQPYVTDENNHIFRLADAEYMRIPPNTEDYPIELNSDVKWRTLNVNHETLGFVTKHKCKFSLELSFRYGVPIANFFKYGLGDRHLRTTFFKENEKNFKGSSWYPSILGSYSAIAHIPFEQEKFWNKLIKACELVGIDKIYCTDSSLLYYYTGWTSDYKTHDANPVKHETFFSLSSIVDFGPGGGGGNYKQLCYGLLYLPKYALNKVYCVTTKRFLDPDEAKPWIKDKGNGGWNDSIESAVNLSRRMLKEYDRVERWDADNEKFQRAYFAYADLARGMYNVQKNYISCTMHDYKSTSIDEVILKTNDSIGLMKLHVRPKQAYNVRDRLTTIGFDDVMTIAFTNKELEQHAKEVMKPYIEEYVNAFNELSLDIQSVEMVEKLSGIDS